MKRQDELQTWIEQNTGYQTREYSGRAMFGKNCLGIVVDHVAQAIQFVSNGAGQDGINIMECEIQWDTLGMNYIVYWPDIEFVASNQRCTNCGSTENNREIGYDTCQSCDFDDE